jgi:hypothetical protein
VIRRRAQHRADGSDSQTKAGIIAIAAAAAITSFTHLVDLARAAGWHAELAWLLPITIDLYAAVTTRIWLRRTTPPTVRAHARMHALTAISLSMIGNAVSGALSYGALQLGEHTWLLVVSTHLVAPAALAGVSHLAALLGQHRSDRATAQDTAPEGRPAHATDPPGESTVPNETQTVPTTVPVHTPAPPAPSEPFAPPTVPEPGDIQLTQGVPAPKRATGPADKTPVSGMGTGTGSADRATVPGLARQAVAAVGGRPVTLDLAVPPIQSKEPPRRTEPPRQPADHHATEPTAPVALRPGSRPDTATIEKTRALYLEHRAAGRALTDRQLAAAAQAAGLAIGRRACARIISKETA